ncbi:DNA mismatch repair protein MutL [Actinoplanes sp. GCM10030250]|uniref:DNA mismatch repair protein MutL n=1 Tax=Actinoplanes sp. GCM10030250 TaxID=3273376 RepID=UPI003606EE83
MRSSRWLPIAGWCVATATSIVLSSFALSPVLNAARAGEEALPELGQLPGAEVAVTTTSSPTPPPAVPERPEPTDEDPGTDSPSPSKTSRKPSSKPPTGATTAPATTAPATTTPPTTTENGWTVTTGDDGVKTYVRTFRCDGGQAVIKMTSRGIVTLVTATPADGYSVQKQGSDTNLVVYFTSTARSFIVHAQWWNDAPLVEVNEIGG